ncbi:CCA tRNA nucleotidyltransferase [Lacticigenium naphthae]|uniref:CCA tRNA nucleotidyltransferase n=1 Tax=Lacticigenium naphthae TaxID=515351 RepID=UPI000403C668|nr:CCA tRNA nucleotidyltransferase [Lacticigenium naphthae]
MEKKRIDLNVFPPFLEALPVIKRIEENDFEAFFVGGSVRDVLLNSTINDIDIATSAFPYEIKDIFPHTIDVGIEHGTVMVLFEESTYEVTTFRTEGDYKDFRRPDEVTFVRSLKEDLKRRDFTINALALNKKGEIFDYFNGIKDIEEKKIRAVGNPKERFYEDALRMMRAVRFVSKLDFDLDSETFLAIQEHNFLLQKISVERIQIEFIKLMLGNARNKGLAYFIESELYRYCPSLENGQRALEKIEGIPTRFSSSEEMWAVLGYFMEFNHKQLEKFLRQWKCSKKEIKESKALLAAVYCRKTAIPSAYYMYTFGLERVKTIESYVELFDFPDSSTELDQLWDQLPIKTREDIAITGTDLIQASERKPGKWIADALDDIERAIVEQRLSNQREEILAWFKEEATN